MEMEKIILITTSLIVLSSSSVLDTSGAILSRQKRTLVFQEGLNWVQMVVGIGLPIEVKDHSITMGSVVKSYYALPNNSTLYTHPTITVARGKRSTSRWKFYNVLEYFIESNGYKDGKSCLLRTICEMSSFPFDENAGLLAEILHVFLTPSSTADAIESRYDFEYHAAEKLGRETENCQALFPECDANFMTRFTKVFM